MKLFPVILSGGSGTRLWPMSRQNLPKQFLPLVDDETLFAKTVRRAGALADIEAPLVVANDDHRFMVAESLRAMSVEPTAILLEPVARNTAPAIALAALGVSAVDPEAALLVMPADHLIEDEAAFGRAVDQARRLAAGGQLVTFGIRPTSAETGYGYIRRGEPLGEDGFRVDEFVEKPVAAVAQRYLESAAYAWNSGMFCFRAADYLATLEQHEPAMLAACRRALADAQRDLDFVRVDAEAFGAARADSIDYAVMEKTDRAAVVPVDCGWSDIGSWSALAAVAEADADGNVLRGDVVTIDAQGCFAHTAQRRMLALVGVDDLIVVDTADATLVVHRDRAQDVAKVVATLREKGRTEHQFHRRVYRPWGDYDSVDAGERFQVKRITVKPGASLSLQKHHHRAEHWVVVSGTAMVTRGEETFAVHENESTFIPLGEKHRLHNPGDTPVELIEVQTGSYLGEDDIIRFDDVYGRS